MLFSVPAVRKEYFEILHLSGVNVAQRARFTLKDGTAVRIYSDSSCGYTMCIFITCVKMMKFDCTS